jgi:hypothetical protein
VARLACGRDEIGDPTAPACSDVPRAAKERCPRVKSRNAAKITKIKAAHFDNTQLAIKDFLIGIVVTPIWKHLSLSASVPAFEHTKAVIQIG